MQRLRPSSFSRSWWKLEKLVHGREQNLDFAKIPHEGPVVSDQDKSKENGKGKEDNLEKLESRTTAVPEIEKPPC